MVNEMYAKIRHMMLRIAEHDNILAILDQRTFDSVFDAQKANPRKDVKTYGMALAFFTEFDPGNSGEAKSADELIAMFLQFISDHTQLLGNDMTTLCLFSCAELEYAYQRAGKKVNTILADLRNKLWKVQLVETERNFSDLAKVAVNPFVDFSWPLNDLTLIKY